MMVTLNNVSFSYVPGLPVLHEVSFTLNPGELLLVVGRNGAGKSSLLKLLNGILKPTSGNVLLSGLSTSTTPTSELSKHISVTFQNPADQIFASTVREEIEFGPRNTHQRDIRLKVEESIQLFGLSSIVKKHPYDLLPAQRKLLTIASAVSMGTSALALDEPTAGLSETEKRTLRDVLITLRNQQKGFIVVSHDLEFFLPLSTRVLLIDKGEIQFEGLHEKLLLSIALRKTGIRLPLARRLKSVGI